MKKKNTKKISPILIKKSALKDMSHDDFGAILEHIDGMFIVMVEGLTVANERGDRMEERMDSMEGKMDKMEGRMDSMEGKMDKMEGRMDSMEGKMDSIQSEMRSSFNTIMEYLTRIDTEIQEIKAELSQKAQIKEVKELHGRVLKLELELISIRNSLHLQKA